MDDKTKVKARQHYMKKITRIVRANKITKFIKINYNTKITNTKIT